MLKKVSATAGQTLSLSDVDFGLESRAVTETVLYIDIDFGNIRRRRIQNKE